MRISLTSIYLCPFPLCYCRALLFRCTSFTSTVRLSYSDATYGHRSLEGILNSNMMQSLMPDVDHGNQLKGLFCREGSLPHCVGGVPAAEHALNYATDFLKLKAYRGVPKAAFVHLTDGHEDTLTMIRSVDAQIASFVERHSKQPENGGRGTTVVVLSDHGLHYGSYFSTPSGQIEHQSPLLYIRPHEQTPASWASRMTENAMDPQHLVTPYDLHETILMTVRAKRAKRAGRSRASIIGSSLYRSLPRRNCVQAGIPAEYCPGSPVNEVTQHKVCAQTCTPLAMVPSLDAYYAGLPAIEKGTRGLIGAAVTRGGEAHKRSNGRSDDDDGNVWAEAPELSSGIRTRRPGLIKIVPHGQIARQVQLSSDIATGAYVCECFASGGVTVHDKNDLQRGMVWRACNATILGSFDDFVVARCNNASDGKHASIWDIAIDVKHAVSKRYIRSDPKKGGKEGNSSTGGGSGRPNILVLELDSVATPMLERRFPKLKALFDGASNNPICESLAVNSALFTVQSAVGPNSLYKDFDIILTDITSLAFHQPHHRSHRSPASRGLDHAALYFVLTGVLSALLRPNCMGLQAEPDSTTRRLRAGLPSRIAQPPRSRTLGQRWLDKNRGASGAT